MEVFEIHITGSSSINKEFDNLGIKNIIIDLLKPNKDHLRTEFMSSFISKHKDLDECKTYINSILAQLSSEIIRVKIESPFYEHYRDKALYVESHFKPYNAEFPISRNAKSNKELATDRTHNSKEFDIFREKWKNEDVEMCLYDTFVEEDKDWFELYQK